MNTAPDASEAPETPPAGRWRTFLGRRWVLWTGAAVLGAALVTTAVTVPLAVAAAERAAAVDTWKTSLTEAFAASDIYTDAVTAHSEQVAAGTAEVTAIDAILDALPAELVDPATTRDDVAAVAAALQAAASAETPDPGVTALPDVLTPASTTDPATVDTAVADYAASQLRDQSPAQLLDSAAEFRAQTADTDDKRTTLDDSTDTIQAAQENTRAPLAALIAAAIAKAPTFPIDRAGEGERAAFTTALNALQPAAAVSDATAVDVLPLVKGYVDALGAARASHDAVVAAEQEAQRQAQGNADNGSSGDRGSSSPGAGGGRSSSGGSSSNSGGGSSSGGGNSNGGGGSSGGSSGGGSGSGSSSNGGGGSSGPVASPIKLVVSGSCVDFPNSGQSASYGSTLYMPADAAWHETYEIPGLGWGVRWSCF